MNTLVVVAGLLGVLAASECSAVQPYTPVHPDPFLEPWRWRVFPELIGLGLECMAEDSVGNMWFGVSDGAVRYDGITWTHYTSEDGLLGAPAWDHAGEVHFGCRARLCCYGESNRLRV